MLKRFLAVAAFAVLFVPATSHAVDHGKSWALGYFFDDAPVGVRYMLNDKTGLDAGFGFQQEDGPDFSSTDPGATASNTVFTFELGAQFNLIHQERAEFFLRPFFTLQNVPYYLDNGTNITDESVTDTRFGVIVGAEWHATDNLSLSFGTGLGVSSAHGISPGELEGNEPESSSSIATTGLTTGSSSIGFHWYFD